MASPLDPQGRFHPVVFAAYHKADSAAANLYVHQFQTAYAALMHSPQEGNRVGEGNTFTWNWTKEAVSDLEFYARVLYTKCVEYKCNHADTQVAIAGLAQLADLLGEKWDIGPEAIKTYTVLPKGT